jgi:uncharacterized cofD-like protein
MSKLKWLYPGMRVKRYLFLMGIGVMLFSWGLAIAVKLSLLDNIKFGIAKLVYLSVGKYVSAGVVGSIMIIIGIILIFLGVKYLNSSILSVLSPLYQDDLVNIIFRKRLLEKGYKIVSIGGGTGLSTLLRGIKNYTNNITAIVSVADDGGSSGILRDEMGILPPGDLRNCLVALADAEPLMRQLFQYRFENGLFSGHSFGNIFIAAISEVTKDFYQAIKSSSKILSIRGQVLPSTLENIVLEAELEDGRIVKGETNISKSEIPIKKVYLSNPKCKTTTEVLEAIEDADAIIIGPGSLFTSILPNLLIEDIQNAIKKSKALKIYVCNIMTQPGETDRYKVSDHIKTIFKHTGGKIFDCVIVNTKFPKAEYLEKYKKENSYPVKYDREEVKKLGVEVIEDDLLLEGDLIRHDPKKLSYQIFSFIESKKKNR